MINQYRVFQIKEVHHQHWAKSYAQQVEDGFLIHHQNYQSAYKGKPAPSDTPMTARKRLEEKRPNTFIGRSFGVGDVIVWDEEKGRKFFYVDKEELVEFGGFMDADAAGNTVVYMVPNYQIDGKTGTWLPYDSKRKNLSRALFQGRYAQQQNRQKISCTARDLRQAWCQPSLKMFMCMRVGVS